MTIQLRFVQYNDLSGKLITAYEDGAWPDHVEAVLPDGSGYLGAAPPDGVKIRPVGYDRPFKRELFVPLPASDEITTAFYAGLKSHLGEPYDFATILGFALDDPSLHARGHAICSALQVNELVKAKAIHKPCRAPHLIDPASLLLICSALVDIPST
jgi:hypothetical protein